MRIFVDAMGGDFAPHAPVEGAVEEFFAILTAERCRKDRRIHLVEGV